MARSSRKRATPRKRATKRRTAHKRNPNVLVFGANPGGRRTWTRGAMKIGREVDSVAYLHMTEGSEDDGYVHEFEHNGVKLEGLPDGSLRIFHPTLRLWEDM